MTFPADGGPLTGQTTAQVEADRAKLAGFKTAIQHATGHSQTNHGKLPWQSVPGASGKLDMRKVGLSPVGC